MKNLKKFNSVKLNRCEMKQVQGGGVVDGTEIVFVSLGQVLGNMLTSIFGILPKK